MHYFFYFVVVAASAVVIIVVVVVTLVIIIFINWKLIQLQTCPILLLPLFVQVMVFSFFLIFLLPVNFHRIKFLAIAVTNRIEVYAWAPKPYHKFMAFKVPNIIWL